jgi:hypothetical protein
MAPEPSDDDRKSALRSQINENLRRIYDTALEDEVPERFTQLLQQLRGVAAPKGAPDGRASSGSEGTGAPDHRAGKEGGA